MSQPYCDGTILARFPSHTLTPASAGVVEVHVLPAGTASVDHAICGTYEGAGSIHMRYEYSALGNFTDTQLLVDRVVNYPAGECAHVCLPIGAAAAVPCQFGSRPKALVDLALTILPNLVGSWAGTANMAWLAAKLAGLYYTTLDVQDLCSKPPPVPGAIIGTDFGDNLEEMGKALGAIAWPVLCECTPGTPTPAPYPPFFQPAPAGNAAPPVFVVTTPGDPVALAEILQRLSEMQAMLSQDLSIDALQQRWLLPFGTVPGKLLEHVSGEGEALISRLLGVLVTVTATPGGAGTWPGNPIYLKDLGWLAVDDGGAMLQELRVTRQQQTWYPQQMQLATRISWSLTPGTELALQELRVEA